MLNDLGRVIKPKKGSKTTAVTVKKVSMPVNMLPRELVGPKAKIYSIWGPCGSLFSNNKTGGQNTYK